MISTAATRRQEAGEKVQIPGPDTRVVELRVHGIFGSTPRDLTDSTASVDVAGDGIGRIVRPADRFLRPVPGPTLPAGERTVPRVVEGYAWGRMTSGGTKAVWALLFPFALANMAHWMLPPSRTDSRVSRAAGAVLRALLRLTALLLTMLFVAQLTVLTLDLLAAQCLAPGSGCMPSVPDGLRYSEVLRSLLALSAVSLAIATMHRLSTAAWRVLAPSTREPGNSAQPPVLAGGNVVTEPQTPTLRCLHTVAALSIMVLLALGGPFAYGPDPRWLSAAALLLLCLLGTLLLDDPTGSRQHTRNWSGLGRRQRQILVTFAAAVAAAAAIAPAPMNGPLPGSGPTIDLLTIGLLGACAAVGVVLIPAALLARRSWSRLPRQLRPFAGGWLAAPVLLIACMLGDGFGAGLALVLRQALGRPGLQLPAAYDTVTLLWGVTTALIVLAGACVIALAAYRRWRFLRAAGDIDDEVRLLHAGRRHDQHSAARAWYWGEWQRRHSHHALLLLAGLLSVGICLAAAARVWGTPQWAPLSWLILLGVGTLATFAASSLHIVYRAVRYPRTARYVSVLCDLALFWPREAHPVVPPCYALKVVPELVARAREHLAQPDTHVVLVGHSQGSLLAAVATARLLEQLPESDRGRVGLVTAGSQLQWGYSRAFPGVVPHDTQRRLAGDLAGRWRCLCRGTDPIGGAVSTWNRQTYDGQLIGVGFRPDGTEGPLPAAPRGPTGALVLGGDHWLPDPQRGPFAYRRWVPGVLQHAEYSGDPEWDRAIAMAAGLEAPIKAAQLPLQTPSPATPPSSNPADPGHVTETAESHGSTAGCGSTTANHGGTNDHNDRESGFDPELLNELETGDRPGAAPHGAEGEVTGRSAVAVTATATTPEIIEPRGSVPPWERALKLHPSGR